MDHSTAHIMELYNNVIESKTIESAIAHEDLENGSVQAKTCCTTRKSASD